MFNKITIFENVLKFDPLGYQPLIPWTRAKDRFASYTNPFLIRFFPKGKYLIKFYEK